MANKSFSITRYALQSFRHYGGKSIILMIALAVTLVLGLMNIMTSLQRTVELAAISSAGDAHFQFLDVTPEQIAEIKTAEEVEWALEYSFLSRLAVNIPGSNKSAGVIYVENLGKMDGYKIVRGRFPQEINEIALSPYVAEYLGIEARAGTEFEAGILTNRYDAMINGQENIVAMRFRVTGIIQEQEFHKLSGEYFIYVSKEFYDAYADFEILADGEFSDIRAVLVKLKKGYDVYTVVPPLAERLGIDHDKAGYNFSYLYASLHGFENQLVFGIIIAFFMLVGALIIYNAFNVVIAKRTRHFGLLTLIGASRKQIRKCVYIEAMLNTAAALPIGLILGTFLSWLVMPLVSDMRTMPVIFYVNPYLYLLTVLIAVLMVAGGAALPSMRAGKISPVEAAKFSPGNLRMKRKIKAKPEKNITLLSLAQINLFRRKGAGGTVVSLSVVGVLFISIAVILFSVYGSVGNLVKQNMASDIKIMQGAKTDGGRVIISNEKPTFPEDIIKQIINLDGVKKSHVLYHQQYRIQVLEYAVVVNSERYANTGYIFGVDDDILREYLSYAEAYEGGKNDLAVFENPASVLVLDYFFEDFGVLAGFEIGANLSTDIYYGVEQEPTGQADLHVSAVANRFAAPAYINHIGSLPVLVMPLSSYIANGFDLSCHTICLDIDEAKYENISASLEQICASEGNIYFESFFAMRKELEGQLISIIILIFAGLGIVFAVGLCNLVSTTFISIEQRKKELGVLSAIGLGRRELKKMLKLEGIWVSAFSSGISIAGGCILGYLFYLWIESVGGDYINLTVPVLPLIIFCLIYIFVPYIISSIAVRRLLKNTMVELIGQEI